MTRDVEHLSCADWQFFFCIIVLKEKFVFVDEKNLVASVFFLCTSILISCHPQPAVYWRDAAKGGIKNKKGSFMLVLNWFIKLWVEKLTSVHNTPFWLTDGYGPCILGRLDPIVAGVKLSLLWVHRYRVQVLCHFP